MKGLRKTRPDAVLKNLPEERQAEIYAYCCKNSYEATLAWLSCAGQPCGFSPLRRWFKWYQLKAKADALKENEQDLKELLNSDNPDKAAALLFKVDALRDGDREAFIRYSSIASQVEHHRAKEEHNREMRKLEERKVRVREASLKLKQLKQQSDPLTDEQAQSRYKQILGMNE